MRKQKQLIITQKLKKMEFIQRKKGTLIIKENILIFLENMEGNVLKQKLALKRKIASYIELKDAMGLK